MTAEAGGAGRGTPSVVQGPLRLLRNFVVLFVSNVAGQVLLLAAMVHLARLVGPAVFGAWGLAQAWMMYFFRVGEMGYEVAGIRAIATSPREGMRAIVWNVLAVRGLLAIALVVLVITAVTAGVLPGEAGALLIILSVSLLPVGLVLEWVFESQQEVSAVGIARVLKGVLFGVLVLAFVRTQDQIRDAAWYYVASLVVPAVVIFVRAISRYPLWPPRLSWAGLKELTREAFPIGVATVLSQFTLFAGTFFAGYMTTREQLGFYTAGHRLIIFVWAYGIVSSNRVILPQLSRLFASSRDEFAVFVVKYFRILTIVAVPIVVCAIGGGDEVIRILFGESFRQSAPVFKILSIALGFAVTRSVLEIGLVASQRQHAFMHGMLGLVVAYIVLTLAGLAFWDITGAAWAAVIAEGSYAVYLAVVFHEVKVRELGSILVRPVASGIVVLLLLYLTGIRSIVPVVAGGVASYFLMLFALGGITRQDLALVTSMVPGRSKP